MQTGTRREFALGNPKNRSFAPDCCAQAPLQTRFSLLAVFHAWVIAIRFPFTRVLRFLSRKVLENFSPPRKSKTFRNRRLGETRPRTRALPECCGRGCPAILPDAESVAALLVC